MVFEQFLESNKIKKHVLFIFLLGFFYVVVGGLVADYFFKGYGSVAMLFTVTLLLVPSIHTILNIEEGIEKKEGMKHFFKNHKDIFKVYLSLFIGIFLAFVFFQSFTEGMFDYQNEYLENSGDIDSVSSVHEYSASFERVGAIASKNVVVIIIAFILSVVYGAGGLFLITLNASIFAAFISFLMKNVVNAFAVLGIFMIHLIPELGGFLIAAMAGGVLSRAIVKEDFLSDGFRNVMRDSLILLLVSAGLILFAAFLEVFVSANLVIPFL